jgi:hypothetical protein
MRVVQVNPIIVEPELNSPPVGCVVKMVNLLQEMEEDGSKPELEERRSREIVEKVCARCGTCNDRLETYDEETLGLCLVSVCTFVQRQPALAAPHLFRIVDTVARSLFTLLLQYVF